MTRTLLLTGALVLGTPGPGDARIPHHGSPGPGTPSAQALRPETPPPDSLPPHFRWADTLRADTLRADAPRADTLRADSIPLYRVTGIRVVGGRAAATPGGASAVSIDPDSGLAGGASTADAALRHVPLLQIRTNSRGEVQPALRGAGDRQITVLYDGVPLTLGWDHRTDLSLIPMVAARRIVILRGLSTLLSGPNTLGGVVQIEVGRGEERIGRAQAPSLMVGVTGTGATRVVASAEAAGEVRGGEWVLRGGGGLEDREGLERPDGLDLPALPGPIGDLLSNTDLRQGSAFVQGRWVGPGGSWISLSGSGVSSARGVQPEYHLQRPRLWRIPDQSRLLAAASGGTGFRRTPWGEGDLEFVASVEDGWTEIRSYASSDYASVVGVETGDARTMTARILWDHTLGARGIVRGSATWAEVRYEEGAGGTAPAARYRQQLHSWAGEVEWSPPAMLPWGGAARLSAGVALDGAETPETGGKPALGALDAAGARIGFTLPLPGAWGRLHASAGRRARFPSLRELYSGALGRFLPNPGLRPETQQGGELGVTVALPGSGSELQVVGFHQRLSDAIQRVDVVDQGVRKFRRVNRDEVRSTGIEILAAGPMGPRVRGSVDLTLQQVRVSDGPDPGWRVPEYEAPWTGAVRLSRMFSADLRLEGEVRGGGARECIHPETGGRERLGGWGILDLGIFRTLPTGLAGVERETGWRPSRLEASLTASNVLDSLVQEQCGIALPGRTLEVRLRLF